MNFFQTGKTAEFPGRIARSYVETFSRVREAFLILGMHGEAVAE